MRIALPAAGIAIVFFKVLVIVSFFGLRHRSSFPNGKRRAKSNSLEKGNFGDLRANPDSEIHESSRVEQL